VSDFSSRNKVKARKTLARTCQFCRASREYPSFIAVPSPLVSAGLSKKLGRRRVCCSAYLNHCYFLHLYTSLVSISQPFLRCYQSYSLWFSALQDCFLLPFTSLGPLVMTWAGMMLRLIKFSALSCKEQSVLRVFFSCSKI